MTSVRLALVGLFALSEWGVLTTGVGGQEMMVRVRYGDRHYVGQPLAQDGHHLAIVRRDGRWTNVPLKSSTKIEKIADDFQPYSAKTIRERLQKEFGVKYQVSITPTFVVVHPPGDYQQWALPFEQLYQRFRSYFVTRGMALDPPRFPLVAVVLRSRGEFDRFLRAYHDYDPEILGYYSPRSNRIITYADSMKADDGVFRTTLIHEAAHQTAYNVGIHSRFNPTPRWITEGLAMMFEAKGVHNSLHYSDRRDRIQPARLAALQKLYRQQRIQGRLQALIASDHLFQAEPNVAYPMAWGLTFFLAENYPREYFDFLRRDSARGDFRDYSPSDRLRDFALTFGDQLDELEQRMERFYEKM